MLDNIIIIGQAILVYALFWCANTISSLVLNIAVLGDDWDKEKFTQSLWKVLGLVLTVLLLTVGLTLASTESITINTLSNIIYVAAFTRLAEAITKVKDMFGYKAIDTEHEPDSDPEPDVPIVPPVIDTDEYVRQR